VSNLTTFNNDDFFGETIGPEAFKPPRVVIGQPTSSGENVKLGMFCFPDGSHFERIEGLVMIKPTQSRVLYGKKGDKVICRSNNYFQPADPETALSSSCQTCVYQDWGNEGTKKELADQKGLTISNYNRPL
jgi:hypothetical protein